MKEQKIKALVIPRGKSLTFGADPEVFVVDKNNKVIPSEKIITGGNVAGLGYYGVIRDGVQVEFNPKYSYCRQIFIGNVYNSINVLKNHLSANFPGYKVSTARAIKLDKKTFNELSDESKQLGCNPSGNVYDSSASIGDLTDEELRIRSAGGHVHIGSAIPSEMNTLKTPELIIPIFDLLIGNTCVMLDRDKGNAIRRKRYGRAGEYRIQKHGIEYRTLSNFWILNQTLASFVLGLFRQAFYIAYNSTKENNYMSLLMSCVDMEDVKRAINTNDYKLAKKNFEKIEDVLYTIFDDITNKELYNSDGTNIPLVASRRKEIKKFLSKDASFWFGKEDKRQFYQTTSYTYFNSIYRYENGTSKYITQELDGTGCVGAELFLKHLFMDANIARVKKLNKVKRI